jgi:hypothetical protein
LKHKDGDFDSIPMDLQRQIYDFANLKFGPAVLEYLGNLVPKFRYLSVTDLESGIDLRCSEKIPKELIYDMSRALEYRILPESGYRKIDGKRLVGFIIRSCNAIQKEELAEEIFKIVEQFFTPDEHRDPKDHFRVWFGLKVEPSTGGIQCECCKGEKTEK